MCGKDWHSDLLSNFACEHSPSVARVLLGAEGCTWLAQGFALAVEEALAMTGAKSYKAPEASLEMEYDGYDGSWRQALNQHMGLEARGESSATRCPSM